MARHLPPRAPRNRSFLLAAFLPLLAAAVASGQPAAPDALWKKLAPFAQPPEEFAGKFGTYQSPLRFADGSVAKTAADWARRREEIRKAWHQRLGPWPPLVERPVVKKLETVERDGHTEHRVQVQASPGERWVDGYLLVPRGAGPFPAVLVPFYEPLTSIGRGAKGRGVGTHDYGLQLVKRGFVTLSIGTPGSLDKLGGDTRTALTKAGEELRRQPLTLLAYVAANCHTALAQMPDVDPQRIGIIGLSYGGKWSMFASCLDERYACAVWSDPGIVFNEKDSNVNYWEPWYLGYDPNEKRKPGVPSAANPRTGLYKELIDAGEDLVDLHALMAPRPVLVSGGVQDPPRNWVALNHLVAVNNVLGHKERAFLTARKTHVPTAEALELELTFLEHFLKHAPPPGQARRNTSSGIEARAGDDSGPLADPNWFPIAVWLQAPANASRYKDIGINVYVGLWRGPTEKQLAELKKHGLRVVCRQNAVGLQHKDDPTILAWMHNDEPDNAQSLGKGKGYGPPILPAKIVEDYRKIKDADPTRPVFLNMGQGVAWDNYIGRGVRRNHPEDYPEYIKGCDIASFDIYPAVHEHKDIAGKLWYVADGVSRLRRWAGEGKPVWNCIECTHISNPKAKATPAQVKAEVWMSLVRGSRGIIYFVHQFKPTFIEAGLLADADMTAAIKKINQQIHELAPVLNSPAVEKGVQVDSAVTAVPVEALVKRHGGATYVFAVATRDGPTTATFRVAGVAGAATARVLGEDREIAADDGTFQDTFRPWEVHVYQVVPK